MEKIKVHIDFDNTIVMSSERMVNMLNKEFHCNKNWKSMKMYNAKDLFPSITQEHINEVFGSKEFFNKKLKKQDGVEKILNELQDYCEYYIVTLGTESNLKYKEIWCKENLNFDYNFIGLNDFNIKKSNIDMQNDVMIDDYIDMLISTNAKHKLLITNNIETEWNYFNPIKHKDIIPLKDWYAIGDYIKINILGE